MKHTLRPLSKIIKTGLLLLTLMSSVNILNSGLAYGAPVVTFSLTPSTASLALNDDIKLVVKVAAASNQITAAQACLSYDPALLTWKSTDVSDSAFSVATPGGPDDCGSSQIQISRFDISPKSGTVTFASVTFTAKKTGATANITFDNVKSYVRDNATTDKSTGNYINILSGSTGATITLGGTSSSTSATNNSSTNTPALIDRNPEKNDSSLVQAASSDVSNTDSIIKSVTVAAKRAANTASSKLAYMIGGVIILALLAAGLLAKFVGIPGIHMFAKRSGAVAATPTVTLKAAMPQPSQAPNLSHIPDPDIPAPSTIVQPTTPPEQTTSSDQRPPGTL